MTQQALRIARVAVPVPLHRMFDYHVPEALPLPVPGARVVVPFAGRRLVGVCMAVNPEDAHQSPKPLAEVLDDANFLGTEVLQLSRWLSDYYQHPIGEVLATVLPAAARKAAAVSVEREEAWRLTGDADALGRAPKQRALFQTLADLGGVATTSRLKAAGFERTHIRALAAKGLISRTEAGSRPAARKLAAAPGPVLNNEQQQALTALEAGNGFDPVLLDGITGSGKTEVYLRFIAQMLQQGRQVLVLVPEIALTPQTLARFEARFGEAAALHSNLADRARLQTWLKARQGEISIVIGTRSAALTPFQNLGLIVVDEEHDASFKQLDGLRYSARDVAVKRARDLGIPLILGSATPSLESLNNALTGRYRHQRLTRRAGGAEMPTYQLIDIRGHRLDGGLSEPLKRIIGQHLSAGGQVLVFLNRRGFAPSLMCGHCGWQGNCVGCEWPMTMHRQPPALICHHCGSRRGVPEHCPDCSQALIAIGTGTQRCEAVLAEHFSDFPVHRIDRDSTRSQRRLEDQLGTINTGDPAILVGTQMLAKGHHFPAVTLVAVINADGGFLSPDFRAPERTAQLIVQVAGRAGRAERPGTVVIQSYQPDNPLLTTLIGEGYPEFARRELEARCGAGLPPFQPMALIRAEALSAEPAQNWLRQVAARLDSGVEVYGPAPALMPRVADRLRFQLMVLAASRGRLHRALTALKTLEPPPRQVRWSLDIDPYDTF